MLEQRFHRYTTIVQEHVHLLLLIAFGHKSHTNAACGIGSLLQGDMGCNLALASLTNQNILRIYLVGKTADDLIVVIKELDLDFDGRFGEGHQKHVLERFLRLFGFGGRYPLLEQT